MRVRPLEILAGSLVLASIFVPGCNCGDDLDGVDVDAADFVDATAIDAAILIDAAVCESSNPGEIGGACSTATSCETTLGPDSGQYVDCYNDSLAASWPVEGFCIAGCDIDADCGDGNVCFLQPFGAGFFGQCMPACCDEVGEGDACETGRLCTTSIFGDEGSSGALFCAPGTPDVADGAACVTFADCDRNGQCRNDTFQFPGGYCATLRCETDNDCAQAGDGRCVDFQDGVDPICVDDCEDDSDCRMDEGYVCIDRGGTIGKYCQHPAPGDACTVDTDCGLAGQGWTCKTGGDFAAEGYCTVEECLIADNSTCPIFSFCTKIDSEAENFCADECVMAGSTECGTGYSCVGIDPPDGGTKNVCVPENAVIEAPLP